MAARQGEAEPGDGGMTRCVWGLGMVGWEADVWQGRADGRFAVVGR